MEASAVEGDGLMEFCPSCGTRLRPTHVEEEGKTVFTLVCPKCGYKKPVLTKLEANSLPLTRTPQSRITVISKEEQKLRTMPTMRIICPKCGNNTAYVWQVQTRGSDESSTQFFRCTKCEHTFREYS